MTSYYDTYERLERARAVTATEEPDVSAEQLNLYGDKSVDGNRKVGVLRNEEMPATAPVVWQSFLAFEREGFETISGDCCFEGRWSSLFYT